MIQHDLPRTGIAEDIVADLMEVRTEPERVVRRMNLWHPRADRWHRVVPLTVGSAVDLHLEASGSPAIAHPAHATACWEGACCDVWSFAHRTVPVFSLVLDAEAGSVHEEAALAVTLSCPSTLGGTLLGRLSERRGTEQRLHSRDPRTDEMLGRFPYAEVLWGFRDGSRMLSPETADTVGYLLDDPDRRRLLELVAREVSVAPLTVHERESIERGWVPSPKTVLEKTASDHQVERVSSMVREVVRSGAVNRDMGRRGHLTGTGEARSLWRDLMGGR